MLSRVVLAVVVAVVVTLACTLLGGILMTLEVSVAVAVGSFLREFSGVLGVLAGLWYFFSGYTRFAPRV
jgi:hypothetical protein